MNSKIRKALKNVNYDGETTEHNLIQCFLEFVDCGTWSNLDLDTAIEDIEDGEITIEDICSALQNL